MSARGSAITVGVSRWSDPRHTANQLMAIRAVRVATERITRLIVFIASVSRGGYESPGPAPLAVEIFSDVPRERPGNRNSAQTDRGLKFRRRVAVDLPKGRSEMAVAGETQIQAQAGQVVVLSKEIQSTRQPQL